TVTPVGIASLNPTSVNFSSQPIGVPSMAIPVALTNIGDANLAISGVQVSGDNATDFQTSGNTCAGASLIPGASCVVNVKFNPNGTSYAGRVPDALVTFSPLVTSATTTFDTANNRWVTTIPTVLPGSKLKQFEIEIGRIFASGVAFTVPAAGLPGGIKNVTWSAAYSTDTPGMNLRWRWGAAVYSTFSSDYNALKVKPAGPVRAQWPLMTI